MGLTVVLLLAIPLMAGAAGQRPDVDSSRADAALRQQRVALKSLEADLVLEQARSEWRERRERLQAFRHPRRAGARLRPAAEATQLPRMTSSTAPTRAADVLSVNQRVNRGPGFWTQSEVAMASLGRYMVAAWNDGSQPNETGPIAYATSTDAGRTWRAGTPMPLGNGVLYWESDPVLAADPVRGEFWFTALAIVSHPPTNALGVMRGVFSDTGFVWQMIGYAGATRDTLPDKPWIAVDPQSGNVMITYTTFYHVGDRFSDRIEFLHSTDHGLSWSPRLGVSLPSEEGLVQGSRPAAGPDGTVHVVWAAVDTSDDGRALDEMRIRTSHNGGVSFGPPVTLARVVTNFATGAPGFNRSYGLNFPSIAVDWSEGDRRGQICVAWTESADFYSVRLGSLGPVILADESGQSVEFEIGAALRGIVMPGADASKFHFTARRGQTAMFMLDSLDAHGDVALGVGCDDDTYQLAYSDPPAFGRPRVALVSFPHDGVYTLTIALRGHTASGYRVQTGWQARGRTRGRDVRDVFAASSRDGVNWSEPARVNDGPAGTDDWFPEIAVGPTGQVYATWYDWSDSPTDRCASLSNIRLARSADGGRSWNRVGTLSDRASEWTTTASNIIPNQGDYIAMFADSLGVGAGWADARGESPDVYFARFDPSKLPTGSATLNGVSLGAPHPNPSRGELRVAYTATAGVPASIELWDIAGRRLHRQSIEGVAARAELQITLPAGLAAGVYLLRLTQGTLSTSTRVALIP